MTVWHQPLTLGWIWPGSGWIWPGSGWIRPGSLSTLSGGGGRQEDARATVLCVGEPIPPQGVYLFHPHVDGHLCVTYVCLTYAVIYIVG